MRTIQQLAKEALSIQNASNINIVHRWSQTINDLRQLLPNASSTEINLHPINKMWASKVHDLTRMGLSDLEEFGVANNQVEMMATQTEETISCPACKKQVNTFISRHSGEKLVTLHDNHHGVGCTGGLEPVR